MDRELQTRIRRAAALLGADLLQARDRIMPAADGGATDDERRQIAAALGTIGQGIETLAAAADGRPSRTSIPADLSEL